MGQALIRVDGALERSQGLDRIARLLETPADVGLGLGKVNAGVDVLGVLGDHTLEQSPSLLGDCQRLHRFAAALVQLALHVISAGQPALVFEDAGMLPIQALENLHRPVDALQRGVQLAGHLLDDVQIAQVHRQPIGWFGQIGTVAHDRL